MFAEFGQDDLDMFGVLFLSLGEDQYVVEVNDYELV